MIGIADPPRPKIFIDDVTVSFSRRDVRFISDRERVALEELVRAEKKLEGPDRVVEEIVIVSDYLDKDVVRFRTTVRVLKEVASSSAESSVADEGKS